MSQGRRTVPLPKGWHNRTRPRILRRDAHRCTWNTADPEGHWRDPAGQPLPYTHTPRGADLPGRCPHPARDVDHTGAPTNHDPRVLRAICGPHHDRRTGQQANAASPAFPPRKRPAQRHPGLAG